MGAPERIKVCTAPPLTHQAVKSGANDTTQIHLVDEIGRNGHTPPDIPASKEINHERHYFVGREKPAPEP